MPFFVCHNRCILEGQEVAWSSTNYTSKCPVCDEWGYQSLPIQQRYTAPSFFPSQAISKFSQPQAKPSSLNKRSKKRQLLQQPRKQQRTAKYRTPPELATSLSSTTALVSSPIQSTAPGYFGMYERDIFTTRGSNDLVLLLKTDAESFIRNFTARIGFLLRTTTIDIYTPDGNRIIAPCVDINWRHLISIEFQVKKVNNVINGRKRGSSLHHVKFYFYPVYINRVIPNISDVKIANNFN